MEILKECVRGKSEGIEGGERQGLPEREGRGNRMTELAMAVRDAIFDRKGLGKPARCAPYAGATRKKRQVMERSWT
jgi:hypothetical protein